MPRPLYLLGKSPCHPLHRRLGGSQSQSGHCGGKKNLALLGIELGPYSPLPVTILTELLGHTVVCINNFHRFGRMLSSDLIILNIILKLILWNSKLIRNGSA
jgi:hypothetical protein